MIDNRDSTWHSLDQFVLCNISATKKIGDLMIRNTRPYVDVMEVLVMDWPNQVRTAIRLGTELLYIGCRHHQTRASLINEIQKPKDLFGGNLPGMEPSYLSLEEANVGYEVAEAAKGASHTMYIVINVVTRELVDFVDRNGTSHFTQTSLEEARTSEPGFKAAASLLETYLNAFMIVDTSFRWEDYLNDQKMHYKQSRFLTSPTREFAETAISQQIAESKRKLDNVRTSASLRIIPITQELIDQFYLAHAKRPRF